MKTFPLVCLSFIAFVCKAQTWNQNGDNSSTGNLTINGSYTSFSNYGLIIQPSGDAVIRRGNAGNVMISSGGGSSDVRFNYSYGGGSGGVSIFDGGTSNNTNLKVNGSGHLIISPSGNNVGIGTTSPADQVEVVSGNRKVGLNTQIPGVTTGGAIATSRADDGVKTLFIGSSAAPADDNVIFSGGGNSELRFFSSGGPYATAGFGFYINPPSIQAAFASDRPVPIMKITGAGLVGIGTTNPDKALTVKGTIHTNEVLVDINSPIQPPDYVFEKDYNLLPLAEVESYIKQNKHLPEVPSAKQMEEDGLNLKEMNLLLLKKVEELTLHVIELKKENEAQQREINSLRQK